MSEIKFNRYGVVWCPITGLMLSELCWNGSHDKPKGTRSYRCSNCECDCHNAPVRKRKVIPQSLPLPEVGTIEIK